MRIRPISPGDVESIVNIEARVSSEKMGAADIITFLGIPNTRGFVGEEGENNIVAYALFRYPNEVDTPVELYRLVVDEDFRRNGFGAKLVERVADLSYSRGFNGILITVAESDKNAVGFMSSFESSSELIKNWSKTEDGIRFHIFPN